MLYTTDRTQVCALRNVLRRTSYSASSTFVALSFATNFFTAYLTSRAMTSSFSSQQLSVERLPCSILPHHQQQGLFLQSSVGFSHSTPLPMPISERLRSLPPLMSRMMVLGRGVMQLRGSPLTEPHRDSSVSSGSSLISTSVIFQIRLVVVNTSLQPHF